MVSDEPQNVNGQWTHQTVVVAFHCIGHQTDVAVGPVAAALVAAQTYVDHFLVVCLGSIRIVALWTLVKVDRIVDEPLAMDLLERCWP